MDCGRAPMNYEKVDIVRFVSIDNGALISKRKFFHPIG